MIPIFPVKGRYIVIVWLAPYLLLLPGAGVVFSFLDPNTEWFWFDIVFYYTFHLIFISVMILLFGIYQIHWKSMLSRVEPSEYVPAIKLTAFVFVFSIAAAYALFYPLSYVFPEFVTFWFIDIPPFIFSSQGEFPLVPNTLSFLSLVLFAPVIEEFAFRGILLHRWGEKYGLKIAIVLSSLLFGIAHPDPIGATAFGMAMCVLYLRTKTLLIPIICHALTNLTVWFWEVGNIVWLGSEYTYTLEDFRNGWDIGVVSALIVIVWSYAYMKRPKNQTALTLPQLWLAGRPNCRCCQVRFFLLGVQVSP
jgi:membrane protease YdiL (CAAX protease family)